MQPDMAARVKNSQSQVASFKVNSLAKESFCASRIAAQTTKGYKLR